MGRSGPEQPSKGRCPICGDPTEHAFRPFCSRRCANIDLSRWLTGAYAIGGDETDADEDGDTAAARNERSLKGDLSDADE